MSQHTSNLHFGADQILRLELDSDSLVADCIPRAEPLADVGAATKLALQDAREHPPWSQTVYPGDRVVIAVDAQLPQTRSILDAIIETTKANGVSAGDITVLFAAYEGLPDDGVSVRESWQSESALAADVNIVIHQPENRAELAYVAATEEGDPLMVNRYLADADVVLLVSVTRGNAALGYCGATGLLCHTFGDSATMRRFRTFHAGQSKPQSTRWTHKKSEEAAWNLGANFTLQAVPGVNGEVLQLIAGKHDAVAAAAQTAFEEAWRYRLAEPAELVVAAVDAQLTSWLEVATAANAAARLVDDDGSIVLLTELQSPPGRAVGRLTQVESPGEVLAPLQTETSADVVAAIGLAHVLERTRVYLVSNLDEDQCQDLHFVHVDEAGDIQRLAGRSESTILLHSAQFADVQLQASEVPL